MVDTLEYISIGLFILAVISLAFTIYLYIKLDIKYVINFLSGKAASREIEQIRQGSKAEQSKKRLDIIGYDKKMKTSGLLTAKRKVTSEVKSGEMSTESLTQQQLKTEVLQSEATEVLNQETVLLNNETTVLESGTTILTTETDDLIYNSNKNDIQFIVEEEIKIIHTDEVI